jgi:hypothetical protein
MDSANVQEIVMVEWMAERAAALARTADRFEQSLGAYRRLELELEFLAWPQRRAREEELRHARARATLHLSELIRQRESNGLLRHEPIYSFYGVPDEVRMKAR